MKSLGTICLIVLLSGLFGCAHQKVAPQPGPQAIVMIRCDAPFEIVVTASEHSRCSPGFVLSETAASNGKLFEYAGEHAGASHVTLNLDRYFERGPAGEGQLLQVRFTVDRVTAPDEMLVFAHADHAIIEFGGKRCRFPYSKAEFGTHTVYDWAESPHVPGTKK